MKILLLVTIAGLLGSPCLAQDLELEITEPSLNHLLSQLGDPGKSGIYQVNPLGALGYSSCQALGTIDCSGSSSTTTNQPTTLSPPSGLVAPTGQRGTTTPLARNVTPADQQVKATAAVTLRDQQAKLTPVRLSVCQGPNGKQVIVPGAEPVLWQWWITNAHFTIQAGQLAFTANVRYRVGARWFSDQRTVTAAVSFDAANQRIRIDVSAFKVPVRYAASGFNETITEVDVGRYMSFGIPTPPQTFQTTDLDGRLRSVNFQIQTASVQYLSGKMQVKLYAGFN